MTSILVVDDLRKNVLTLSYGLENEGYQVYTAASGVEALQMVSQDPPDLILLDVMQSEVDGFEVCEAIKSQVLHENIPVIFVSANDSDDFVVKAMKAGARDYITKPIRFDVLSAKIESALDNSVKQQSLVDANERLNNKFQENKMLLECAGEGIFAISITGDIVLANTKAVQILGLEINALNGVHLSDLLPDVDVDALLNNDLAECHSGKRVESFIRRADGEKLAIEFSCSKVFEESGGVFTGWVFIFQDISARKAIEQKMLKMAKYDSLTGLANRGLFRETLSSAIARAGRNQHYLALLFVDLDHFKSVNDNLGHAAGDSLLRMVSDSLRNCIRRGDTAARLGGDEFCILLDEVDAPNAVMTVAQKVLKRIAAPFYINGAEVYISASIGIAMFPESGENSDDLLMAADTAMYRAKSMGRNNSQFFCSDMQTQLNEQLKIVAALHRAVGLKEFEAYYQPQLDVSRMQINGLETLSRWPNAEYSHVSTQDYIQLAEQYGLIADIGVMMLEKACRQGVEWLNDGVIEKDFRIAVNVSPKQLLSATFVSQVQAVLEETALPASMLEIEVTETAMMENPDLAIEALTELHQLNIKISVDDFGTGYSSLNYLKKLPIDTLKIDRCFVNGINQDPADESIIKTIISLAHNLNLEVVAEGVETAEQYHFLKALSCDRMQGYYLSKPMTNQDTLEYLNNLNLKPM